jgi:hypothetical protein
MKAPEKRNGMEGAMRQVEAQIGQDQYFHHLQPKRLGADRREEIRRHHQPEQGADRGDEKDQPEGNHHRIGQHGDQIVQPVFAEEFLLAAQRKQIFQRDKNQRQDQQGCEIYRPQHYPSSYPKKLLRRRINTFGIAQLLIRGAGATRPYIPFYGVIGAACPIGDSHDSRVSGDPRAGSPAR